MGVPAFFRWLTLRYPKSVVDSHPSNLQHDLPHFDNLYLDMNGIIHPCCHPQDSSKALTEGEMFAGIARYIDSLCAIVRPRKLIYLAVDGVAPRAKMNQQRARRYRKIQEEAERSRGRPASSPSFDSNVITPGTDFMHRLSLFLNTYIQQQLTSEWADLTVLFSVRGYAGFERPGGGRT